MEGDHLNNELEVLKLADDESFNYVLSETAMVSIKRFVFLVIDTTASDLSFEVS